MTYFSVNPINLLLYQQEYQLRESEWASVYVSVAVWNILYWFVSSM